MTLFLYCRVKPEVLCKTTHLHDIKELPIFAQPSKMLTTEKAIGVLLFSGLTEELICSRVPFSVDINSVFVVDLNQLSSAKDINCDDMGVWTWGGSNKRCVCVDEYGLVEFVHKKDEKPMSKDCYKVWKRYYSLKVSPDVKKLILMLEGTVLSFVFYSDMQCVESVYNYYLCHQKCLFTVLLLENLCKKLSTTQTLNL